MQAQARRLRLVEPEHPPEVAPRDSIDQSGVRTIPDDRSAPAGDEPSFDLLEDLTDEAITWVDPGTDRLPSVPPPLPAPERLERIDLEAATRAARRSDPGASFFPTFGVIPAAPVDLLRVPDRSDRRAGLLERLAVIGSAMLVAALLGLLPDASATRDAPAGRAVGVDVSPAAPSPVTGAPAVTTPRAVLELPAIVIHVAPTAPAALTTPAHRAAVAGPRAAARASTALPRTAAVDAPAAATPAPVPTPEPSPARPALPTVPRREDILRAMNAVRAGVLRCVSGVHGEAPVRVTVGGDGRVRSVNVSGAFAGTSTGSCIARAVRTARLGAFEQPSFSFEYPFAF